MVPSRDMYGRFSPCLAKESRGIKSGFIPTDLFFFRWSGSAWRNYWSKDLEQCSWAAFVAMNQFGFQRRNGCDLGNEGNRQIYPCHSLRDQRSMYGGQAYSIVFPKNLFFLIAEDKQWTSSASTKTSQNASKKCPQWSKFLESGLRWSTGQACEQSHTPSSDNHWR